MLAPRRLLPLKVVVATVILLASAALAGYAQTASPSTAVIGTIAGLDGSNVTVQLADQSIENIVFDPSFTMILAREPATLADITAGVALGVAARRSSDGQLTATSISIFPAQLWNTVRKGQWMMDSGETMTNALVKSVTADVQGRVLTMQYAGGEATIVVPDDARMYELVSRAPRDLQVGERVALRAAAEPNGEIVASSVSFDQAGG